MHSLHWLGLSDLGFERKSTFLVLNFVLVENSMWTELIFFQFESITNSSSSIQRNRDDRFSLAPIENFGDETNFCSMFQAPVSLVWRVCKQSVSIRTNSIRFEPKNWTNWRNWNLSTFPIVLFRISTSVFLSMNSSKTRRSFLFDFQFVNVLTSINELKFSRSNLKTLPNQFRNLRCLIDLDLSSNQLTQINSLKNLSALRILNLSRNQIQQVQVLAFLIHLNELDLTENRIKSIPNSFDKLVELRCLKVEKNQIESFDDMVKNSINNFPPERKKNATNLFLLQNVVSRLSSLLILRVQGNPFVSQTENYLEKFSELCPSIEVLDDVKFLFVFSFRSTWDEATRTFLFVLSWIFRSIWRANQRRVFSTNAVKRWTRKKTSKFDEKILDEQLLNIDRELKEVDLHLERSIALIQNEWVAFRWIFHFHFRFVRFQSMKINFEHLQSLAGIRNKPENQLDSRQTSANSATIKSLDEKQIFRKRKKKFSFLILQIVSVNIDYSKLWISATKIILIAELTHHSSWTNKKLFNRNYFRLAECSTSLFDVLLEEMLPFDCQVWFVNSIVDKFFLFN